MERRRKRNSIGFKALVALTLSVSVSAASTVVAQQPAAGDDAAPAAGDWQPKTAALMTRWAKHVSPDKALPEYPRPQLVRKDWHNLNGLWEYAIRPKGEPRPAKLDGQILVPFPAESALSGVMKEVGPDNRLWYRRTFTVPQGWGERRVLLHFGAVDWDATVTVNGTELGSHKGGYDPFSFDVTDVLKKGDGARQEIVVSVWDPSDAGFQPRGKQVRKPGGIFYTPATGIWQTVWLEPVAPARVDSLKIVPDVDKGEVRITANAGGEPPARASVKVTVLDAGREVATASGPFAREMVIKVPDAKLWTPETPHLYDLRVSVEGGGGGAADAVDSYFGMRKVSLGKDERGITRIMLNNKFVFQYGPLDQGYWPDGIYTAPTDAALKYDIEITKELGFNMARKHVKVEPARWYYWADKLGLLVWQDMPSGEKSIGANDPDIVRTPESAQNFEHELGRMITAFGNHPSIVMWVPFNEGWGQYDTARVIEYAKRLDPSRLVNNASGWTDRGVGDVIDMHKYPNPGSPRPEANRAAVLGEFGGLGLPVEGHTWLAKGNWGYKSYSTKQGLEDAYLVLLRRLHPLVGNPGLSAAVYTQTTDVEVEVNGILTYDREVIKMDKARLADAHRRLYGPPPERVTLMTDASAEAQTWQYTFERPAGDAWTKPDFDAAAWRSGPAGFGTAGTPGGVIRTEWNTPEIWVRREFEIPAGTSFKEPALVMHHDEDAEVYLNGVPAAAATGHVNGYEEFPISAEARAALKPGRNVIAIHCKQTAGGQYIDAGLVDTK